MSPLDEMELFKYPPDETELFTDCQFEPNEDVNALSPSVEYSLSQYTRTQIQRTNDARQRINQDKAKKDAVNHQENIETTISEDLAEGQTAKLDASLSLLGDDDVKLLLPSDELEDDEIHIIETEDSRAPGGDHALQDYQMQLMLLEQRRLVQARLDREEHALPFDDIVAGREPQRRKLNENISRDRTSTPVMSQTHLSHTVTDDARSAKRQKRSNGAPGEPNGVGAADPVNSRDSNVAQTGLAEDMPPYIDLLYRVSCTDDKHSHPVPAFRDIPVPAFRETPFVAVGDFLVPDMHHTRRKHLNGTASVFDLKAFMENDSDGIGFVVIRTIECSEASVLIAEAGGQLRWTEAIYAKAKISNLFLQEVATCYFQPPLQDTAHTFLPNQMNTPRASDSWEYNRIEPASLFLFHHRESLRSRAQLDSEAATHINALLEYMDNRFGTEFAAADTLINQGRITQEHIRYLFKPNDLIISGTHGKPAAFVLQKWPQVSGDGWITLICWSFQTDSAGFARKATILNMPPLGSDTMEINHLTAYPLKFASSELQDIIRSQGKKHWELRTQRQVTYKGWNVARDQFFPDARFMIDHKIYRKMHEHSPAFRFQKPQTTYAFDPFPAYLRTDQEPPDDAFLLMPPDIPGFYLNEKKWIKIFVDSIQAVTWNKKAFERLVLPSQTKDLVRALVTVRTSQRGVKQGLGVAGKRTDITNGKGNGLIMLLHGGPGTGKTLTGESVAEIAEMPLYRVTCGDIGTNAEAVEKYLNTVLHLGKAWNCVLLLDEADVFLEERSMSDLKRNSLVSVFLRILEYYDGILILTSNRVGIFDEAFKSRIQVALHYENLNRVSRKRIWQNFLDMLEEDEENVNFDQLKYHLDDLAERELNGRQIRNVLTTARQLAIYRNERLDWQHLNQALTVSSDFNEYLKRMQGHSDDQRARDIGLR